MNKFQEPPFEVHIVGYTGTDLSQVPKPFFTNVVSQSTQGFACIATAELQSISDAYKQFDVATRWCEKELTSQSTFGVHAKLEQVRDQQWYALPVLQGTPERRMKTFGFVQSALASAWDVHLDGLFDPALKKVLHEDGYIILDYASSGGVAMSTLTMHFLRPEECIEEYERINALLRTSGGFTGNVYWEDPLAFVVYGPTIPRPVVLPL